MYRLYIAYSLNELVNSTWFTIPKRYIYMCNTGIILDIYNGIHNNLCAKFGYYSVVDKYGP